MGADLADRAEQHPAQDGRPDRAERPRTRDYHQMQKFARALEVGKVWCNCYYLWPSHTSFGGWKNSGFGREMHKDALNNYRRTKSIVHSFGSQAFGFF
ncbi:MAG TPA: aldehyde dehydrogenase family protein [Phycicoccus sp.]|nr:aldehyde dehydrogenase family protein [Phycicoccus sp.]HQH07534.1 aldehyde dehydrogenase family protein [Phycicoccus sp.]HQK30468.1 aldehyde dehydrogenase family protein [Phycicoccus sp.]